MVFFETDSTDPIQSASRRMSRYNKSKSLPIYPALLPQFFQYLSEPFRTQQRYPGYESGVSLPDLLLRQESA